MLSRVANSLYWLSRYLERAENLTRLVDVNRYDALDSIASAKEADPTWSPLLYATCSQVEYEAAKEASEDEIDVSWFITFSTTTHDSIRQCIAQARENARMVRDQISEEMWLELNSFHLFLQSKEAEILWENRPDAFYRRTIKACMLLAGLINATVLQDEGWHFMEAGRYLERADKTTRVLDMLSYQPNPNRGKLASALRSCSALSAYRAENRGEITLDGVIDFLLFSPSFPRSVRFCLRQLDSQLHAISGSYSGSFTNEAERLAGSALAQLNFSSIQNVLNTGYHEYIDGLQLQFNRIGRQIFETYILLPQEINSLPKYGTPHWQQQQQQQ
ncbi:alpha-E domain-containing protein [Rubritalea spongiae]|uniref:Alpha-E domain-containing protein n=1 Tax=Rubritalea spongiae TaxID=430797 RepID=A0ABW5DXJ7_9BACT